MDLKPIVTNFGDDELYNPLSKEIERRLPSKSVEWKRSFGRLSKTVCLKATFTRYNSDTVGGTSEGSVNKQPFLHIYWTSCMENDDYRNSIKKRIVNWQQNLKSRDIHDWLVIQVVKTQDSSKPNRTKITLPRSSVFDKIKNDICGKIPSRCAQLWEPDKETLSTKSAESWEALVSQLRELLLESISRHLTKFEEKVRSQREKYAEPNWSFVEYLKLNEELATILKSVTLHEDALIQYDELDALFSQFVVNGKIKGKPPWLEQFTKTFSCCDGISLHKQAVKFFRDIVYDGKATLLELRNYIFIRQWQMLAKINKDSDVVHRLLEFLFTVVNEIKILEVDVPDYIPACWVVSSCLEFIRVFEKKEMTDQPTIACFAQIHDYAREKLLSIGERLNLLPSKEPATFIDGVVGLCKSHQVKDDSMSGSKSLLNGLLSKEAFEKLYLNLCEKTRMLYTNVGRHRFAIKAAIDLAKFHLKQKDYSLAETYLERALHTFGQRVWEVLHIDVLEPLAECLCNLQMFDRYLWSLACLSCTKTLPFEKRVYYSKEFLNIAEKKTDKGHIINTEPVLNIEDVKIDLVKEIGHIGEIVTVILNLRSNLPLEFRCDGIEIRLRYSETDSAKLSEVDGENTPSKPVSGVVKWSEIIKKPDSENIDTSERKLGLLQRIRSKRTPKQPEPPSKNDNVNTEKASVPENIAQPKRVPSAKVISRKLDMNSEKSTVEKNGVTLAEMARGSPLAKDIFDDRFKSEIYRTDSASSSLSNISIVSDVNESTAEKIVKNHDLDAIENTKERTDSVNTLSSDSDGLNEFKIDDDKGNTNQEMSDNNNLVFNDTALETEAIDVHEGASGAGGGDSNEKGSNEVDAIGKESIEADCDAMGLNKGDSSEPSSILADAKVAEYNGTESVIADSNALGADGMLCNSANSNEGDSARAGVNALDSNTLSMNNVDSGVSDLDRAESKDACSKAVHTVDAGSNASDFTAADSDTVGFDGVDSKVEILAEEDTPCLDETDKDTNGFQNGQIENNLDAIPEEILAIEEEQEVVPAQKLSSASTTLRPGLNSVALTAKVLHEGRYTLQSMSCKIGNVSLYHLLGLPRKSRAFFVVSDPPKFTWTSTHLAECLLLGSKQRVHVTLSNGPGHIPACSVIRISTSTGLEFSSVSPSSVFVYSPNKKDEPKEGAMQIELENSVRNSALMYLPECGAYEMVDLFFDVLAPVESSDTIGHMAKHEVSLECLWLNDVANAKTKLESIFYEPFTIDHDYYVSSAGQFLHTVLRNLNPVQITIQNPELKCLNSDQISFKILQCDFAMTINAGEDLCLVWLVENNQEDLEKQTSLTSQLTIQFKTEKQEEFGSFHKTSEVAIIKPLLAVNMSLKGEENGTFYQGTTYKMQVRINMTKETDFHMFEYIMCILEDNDQWRFKDENKCRKFEKELRESGEIEIISEIIPCKSGKLEYPKISLLKSLIDSTDAKDETRTTRTPSTSKIAVEKLSSSRRTSQTTAHDTARPFGAGEIVFCQAGKFIDVNERKKLLTDV